MGAHSIQRDSRFELVTAGHVLPESGHRRFRRKTKSSLQIGDQRSGGFGGKGESLLPVRWVDTGQYDPIGKPRPVVQGNRGRRCVNHLAIGHFDVEVKRLLVYTDGKTHRSVVAPHLSQRLPVEGPVVEVAVDRWTPVQAMTKQLLADTVRIVRRKLLGILCQRAGKGARGAGEHLLLGRAQSRFGFPDELTARPGQHERQQADQE